MEVVKKWTWSPRSCDSKIGCMNGAVFLHDDSEIIIFGAGLNFKCRVDSLWVKMTKNGQK